MASRFPSLRHLVDDLRSSPPLTDEERLAAVEERLGRIAAETSAPAAEPVTLGGLLGVGAPEAAAPPAPVQEQPVPRTSPEDFQAGLNNLITKRRGEVTPEVINEYATKYGFTIPEQEVQRLVALGNDVDRTDDTYEYEVRRNEQLDKQEPQKTKAVKPDAEQAAFAGDLNRILNGAMADKTPEEWMRYAEALARDKYNGRVGLPVLGDMVDLYHRRRGTGPYKGQKPDRRAADIQPMGRDATAAEIAQNEAGPSLGDAARRGGNTAGMLAGRAGQAIGEVFGLEGLAKSGEELAEYRQSILQSMPEGVKLEDINSLRDVGQWLKQIVGEQGVLMAPTLIGGGAGGLIARQAVTKLALSRAAASAATGAGAAAGSFVPAYTLALGEQRAEMARLDPDAKATGATMAVAGATALLDTALPGYLGQLARKTFGDELGEKVAANILTMSVPDRVLAAIGRTLKEGGKGGAIEFSTEFSQSIINHVGAALQTGKPVDEDYIWNALEEGITGGVMGAGISTAVAGAGEGYQVARSLDPFGDPATPSDVGATQFSPAASRADPGGVRAGPRPDLTPEQQMAAEVERARVTQRPFATKPSAPDSITIGYDNSLTEADRSSPIPTRLIARGKEASGLAEKGQTQTLKVPQGTITSKYGVDRGTHKHAGVDIVLKGGRGAPVPAAGDGKVVWAKPRGAYGNYVMVEHSDGTRTAYAHLDGFDVKVGDTVKQGQSLGPMGNTGRSSGPHLHFEIIGKDGKKINPLTGKPIELRVENGTVVDEDGNQLVEEDPQLALEPEIDDAEIAVAYEEETGDSLLAEDEEPVYDEDEDGNLKLAGVQKRGDPTSFKVIGDALRTRLDALAQNNVAEQALAEPQRVPEQQGSLTLDTAPTPSAPVSEAPVERPLIQPGSVVEPLPRPKIASGSAMFPSEDPVAAEPASPEPVSQVAPPSSTIATDDGIITVEVIEPTEAQKEAGNYKKPSVKFGGLDISVENVKGSERSGTDPNGERWSVTMPATYGYVKRTKGADNEQVDVYLGDNPEARVAYVVDQVDAETGKFDEHKVMVGFDTKEQATSTYEAGFSDGKGAQRIGGIREMTMPELKLWLAQPQKKPAADTVSTTEPAETGQPKGGDQSTEADVLELTQKMPERPASKLDDIPAEQVAAAFTAVQNGSRNPDGSLTPAYTTAADIRTLVAAGVPISEDGNLSIPKEAADQLLETGLEDFVAPEATATPQPIDRGPEAPAGQRYMLQAGDQLALGATPEAAIAEFNRFTGAASGEVVAAGEAAAAAPPSAAATPAEALAPPSAGALAPRPLPLQAQLRVRNEAMKAAPEHPQSKKGFEAGVTVAVTGAADPKDLSLRNGKFKAGYERGREIASNLAANAAPRETRLAAVSDPSEGVKWRSALRDAVEQIEVEAADGNTWAEMIFRPARTEVRKKSVPKKLPFPKLDKKTGEPVLDDDGNPIMVPKTVDASGEPMNEAKYKAGIKSAFEEIEEEVSIPAETLEGVREEEVEATGIVELLELVGNQWISKEGVLDMIEQTLPDLQETVQGDFGGWLTEEAIAAKTAELKRARAADWLGGFPSTILNLPADNYFLRSGEGYTDVWARDEHGNEVFLHTSFHDNPGREGTAEDVLARFQAGSRAMIDWYIENHLSDDWSNGSYRNTAIARLKDDPRRARYRGYTVEGDDTQDYFEVILRVPAGSKGNPAQEFREDHWQGEAAKNAIAHLRFSVKNDPDGRRILFLEEAQSKWHQQAKEEGYRPADFSEDEIRRLHDGYNEAADRTKSLKADLTDAIFETIKKVPLVDYNDESLQLPYHEFLFWRRMDHFKDTYLDDGRLASQDGAMNLIETFNNQLKQAIKALPEDQALAAERALEEAEAIHSSIEDAEETERQAYRNWTRYREQQNLPPEGPWQKTWSKLVLKRAIMAAAQIGADRLVWIHGDMQNGGRAMGSTGGMKFYGDHEGKYWDDEQGKMATALMPAVARSLVSQWNAKVQGYGVPLKNALLFPGDIARLAGNPPSEVNHRGTGLDAWDGEQISMSRTEDIGFTIEELKAKIAGLDPEHYAYDNMKRKLEQRIMGWQHILDQRRGRNSFMGFDITPAMREAVAEGLTLFRRDGVPPSMLGEPRTREDITAVKTMLDRTAKQFNIADSVRVSVGNYLIGSISDRGSYTPSQRLIEIALANSGENVLQVFGHEALHHLREMDVLSKEEWLGLAARAKVEKHRSGYTYAEWAALGYKGKSRETQLEEGIAEMVGDVLQQRLQAKGLLATAAQKIRDVIHWISNAIKITTHQPTRDAWDTMRRIHLGEVGARDEGSGGMGRRWTAEGEAFAEETLSAINWQPSLLERPDVKANRYWKIGNVTRGLIDAATGKRAERTAEFDEWRRTWQDNMIGVKRLTEDVERLVGRPLSDDEHTYVKENLFRSKAADQLGNLNKLTDEITEDMRNKGLSRELLGKYLALKHAPHRDAHIAAINPAFRNLAPDQPGGSGYSANDLAQLQAEIQASGKSAELAAVAQRVYALNQWAQQVRLDAGLISQDDFNNSLRFYVPLRGKDELDQELGREFPNIPSGMSVRGRESRRATGRTSIAPEADILVYAIAQAQEAIMRAGTNEVARSVYELYKLHPDPNFWTHNPTNRQAVRNSRTGMISYRASKQLTADQQDRSIGFKIDGVQHWITFNENSPTAMRVVNDLRKMGVSKASDGLRLIGNISAVWRNLQTTYSPDFVLTNLARDTQTGAFNLLGSKLKDKKTVVIRDALNPFGALGAAWRGAYKGAGSGNGQWARVYDRYVASGGKINYNRVTPLHDLMRQLETAIDKPMWHRTKEALLLLPRVIEHAVDGVENAIRLSAFKHALDVGMSEQQAAELAKNLTVNFHRHGDIGPNVNALYPFFNASIQGSAAHIITWGKNPKGAAAAAGLLFGLGFFQNLLNQALSDEDEDGEKYYDKLPEHVKATNWIIWTPGGDQPAVKLPMGWVLNAYGSAGRYFSEMLRGEMSPLEAASASTLNLLNAFNPVGAQSFANAAAPMLLDPVVDIQLRNKDFTGRPIVPEQKPRAEDQVPESQLAWPGTAQVWRDIAYGLNRIGGGDLVKSGSLLFENDVDVSPETVRYMVRYLTGGAGRTLVRGAELFTKEEISMNDIPLARVFVVDKKHPATDRTAFFERKQEAEKFYNDVERYYEYVSKDKAKSEIKARPELTQVMDGFVTEDGEPYTFRHFVKDADKKMDEISKARRALDEAKMRRKGLTEAGRKAIGKLYGMDGPTSLEAIPEGKVPEHIEEEVRALVKEKEDHIVLTFNREWVARLEKAGK